MGITRRDALHPHLIICVLGFENWFHVRDRGSSRSYNEKRSSATKEPNGISARTSKMCLVRDHVIIRGKNRWVFLATMENSQERREFYYKSIFFSRWWWYVGECSIWWGIFTWPHLIALVRWKNENNDWIDQQSRGKSMGGRERKWFPETPDLLRRPE